MNSTIMERYWRGRKDVWVLLVTLFAAMPLAAATARIYVTNRGGTTISVIDPATNKVVDFKRLSKQAYCAGDHSFGFQV